MTPAAIEEKYGLTPEQYPDYAALRGDPSDNLPGIPGVGEKTAAKWIREYGSLAALVDHADEVKGKVGDALREALPQVLVNRRLTSLVDDVPVELELDAAGLTAWDRAEVDRLFDTLQFRALRERLDKVRPGGADPGESSPVEVSELTVRVVAPAEAASWLAARQGVPAVAVAGDWGRGRGSIRAVAIADTQEIGFLDCASEIAHEAAVSWLADPAAAKDLHDGKGPALALATVGRALAGVRIDTALAAYLESPGQRSYRLVDVAQRVLGLAWEDSDSGDQLLFDDSTDLAADLGRDADAVRRLAADLGPRLTAQGVRPLLDDVEVPLVPLLADMEHAGIAVDVPGLRALSDEFGADMRAAEEEAHRLVGRPFNLGSPKQLQEILFGERNLPKTKKIKTGYTTDAEALQQLFARTQDPLLEQLLAWRDRSKLRQTVDGLAPLADAEGRIHTTFSQTVAATGRLSSADPNLQNIPIRTEAGRRIRGCFVVGAGYECLLTADYSQIEMRIMAHLSGGRGTHRRVPLGGGPPHHGGQPGVRGRAGRGRCGDAASDQGDVVRAGLRAVRLRPVPAAGDQPGRGASPHGRLLRAVRWGARLPGRGRRACPCPGLHGDHDGTSALSARPHERQPAAPGDGRADGPERTHPGVGGRHRQGQHARGRA